MRLARDLIFLILVVLIKIGDSVLFLAKGLIRIPKTFFDILLTATLKKKGKSFAYPKQTTKRETSRNILLFPLPFMVKFKYFIAGGVFSFLFLFIPLLVILFLQELPNPRVMVLSQSAQTTKIYDRNGTILYQIYAQQNRTVVPLASIPKELILATIAIEDKDFYRHPGFDIVAIARSLKGNLEGQELQGGSTITQQLIKSALLSPETTITRKVKEVVLAFWAERLYTKPQILELYFNQIPYGGTAWGVQAASELYFGKSVQDLTLAESAFLAGIPRAPTVYSPFGTTPDAWKKRQKEVLGRMVTLGYISNEDALAAEQVELSFKEPQTPLYAPHFVMYVKDFLVKKYGISMVERGGLSVTTTIDLNLQDQVETIVSSEVAQNAYLHLTNGAALVTNPKNGDVLAMAGSKDFDDPQHGNVNLTTSRRQPGSSIKPVTYSAALNKGMTPATLVDDSRITYQIPGSKPYSPVNYDGKFRGKLPMRLALGNSLNIPAVRTVDWVGVPNMVAMGKKMGIKSWGTPEQYGLSITLGAAEVTMVDMATVFGVFANSGKRVDINPILKITDPKGTVVEQKQPLDGTRVLSDGVSFIISDILSDNTARFLEFGANSPLVIPNHRVSVKTGTSDNKRDNWTIGYTPNALVAVWVGNNDNTPMSQNLASGITGAAPIWNKLMTMMIAGEKDPKLQIPADVVQKPCYGRQEYFIRGTENSVNCNWVFQTPTPSKKPDQDKNKEKEKDQSNQD